MISKAKAPVRISFGTCGDTDYYIDLIKWGNGINATVDLYSYCEVHKRDDKKIVLRSLETGQVIAFDSVEDIEPGGRELNLMKAVVKHYKNGGVEVITHTDAPLESGLGGSAAHAVAMIRAFDQLNGIKRTPEEVAKLAYDIERNVVGIEGGYQDQWSSSYGGMNYMEFTAEGVKITPLKLNGSELNFLEKNTILVFVPREGEGKAVHFEQRKKGQESVPLLMMKRENVLRLKDALERRKFGEIGSILHFDWKIKKQLAPGISNKRIDEIYDAAIGAGALGGRFIGAGAGGSAIFFCPDKREEVLRALEKAGTKEIRYGFERHHAQKDYKEPINERIAEHASLMEKILQDGEITEKAHQITNKIVECYKNDGKVVVFGNGGSAADAQHIVAELVNKFKIDRPMLNAIALTVNTSILTSIANDSTYDEVFSRQIEFLVDSRDVVIGISTSGKAVNVMKALKKAKERGAVVVYFTGKDGGMISNMCEKDGTIDISLKVPHTKTERIQEGHMIFGHIICELVESELYG
ncbi:MAG: SIS domain-containing protein [Candidatus Aenigmarchaeota archaeon]|nr:SIS domain-containing protein [Candidatus Aenigmarchaeota archaeon]